jgi:Predicted transcriptional regulators
MSNDFGFTDLMNKDEHKRKKTNTKNIPIDEIKENVNNNYTLVDIENLANSIDELGLLQPLLVKQYDKFSYELIAGHRRFNAIKKLINEKRLPVDYEVLVKKVDDDENELITRLKLHETNLQTRSLLKMSEKEKLAIINDYMDILNKAKKQGLQINGKPIKGKTRDLISERFSISHYTAQKLIRKVKEERGEEGAKISPQKKNTLKPITQLKKIKTQLEKLEFEGTEEENKVKKNLIELLMK